MTRFLVASIIKKNSPPHNTRLISHELAGFKTAAKQGNRKSLYPGILALPHPHPHRTPPIPAPSALTPDHFH